MGAALEEAADLRTSINPNGDATIFSVALLSKGSYCQNRKDQGQGCDVKLLNSLTAFCRTIRPSLSVRTRRLGRGARRNCEKRFVKPL